jgi:FMN-dependent oxidoreductase (nitrilotriacetate monooxygenase family)
MNLGAIFSASGSHVAAWRYPGAQMDGSTNFQRFVTLAQAAEAACFDFVFFADTLAAPDMPGALLSRTATYVAQMEPMTLLAALAAVTTRVGLVATTSTTYNVPYQVARKFASLDHISGGRAGWNLVTSSNPAEAVNFGDGPHMAHADRYVRAGEFVDVVRGLWDSFDDDAFVRDPQAGIYFDPAKRHALNHKGSIFSVQGPLSVARSPQGHPIISQAGASEPGMALAARTADVVFAAQATTAQAQAYYRSLKDQAAGLGRRPDSIKIMTGILPFVGATEDEARAKFDALQDLIPEDYGLALLSRDIGGGVNLEAYDLDGPVPDLPSTDASKGRQANVLSIARREALTLRQLYKRYATGFGNRLAIGTPSQVADVMEEAFTQDGCDGFIVAAPYLPGAFTDFTRMVVPELQRRGLFRAAYTGETLREHLGLERPVSIHANPEAQI